MSIVFGTKNTTLLNILENATSLEAKKLYMPCLIYAMRLLTIIFDSFSKDSIFGVILTDPTNAQNTIMDAKVNKYMLRSFIVQAL
jgi:hypothetical protein